jgi:LDH2 family malate/lactate/ureidoglycolate dehydrogenase
MKVALTELTEATDRILTSLGYGETEAAVIRDVLFYAELRGNNQGLVKLVTGGIGENAARQAPEIIRQTPVSALIDGHGSQAMVAMQTCLGEARNKANKTGVGIVGLKNTKPSTGAIGYFVRKLAEDGLIGVMMGKSPSYVAAYGAATPSLGTNPVAFGIPTASGPVVFDMASSAIAYFGVVEALEAGDRLPENVAIDAGGKPTTDPASALKGALLPFGGHKGSGLGVVVELLTGPLLAAGFCNLGDDQYGQLLIAMSPDVLADTKQFLDAGAQLKSHIKSGPPLDGYDNILLPGERGDALAARNLADGTIDMAPNLWRQLKDRASQA